jgi:hypothetical protein
VRDALYLERHRWSAGAQGEPSPQLG